LTTLDAAAHDALSCPARRAGRAPRCPPRRSPFVRPGRAYHRAAAGLLPGGIQVVRQKIQVGVIRLVIDGETVAVAARAASSEIHRYKAYATHRGRR